MGEKVKNIEDLVPGQEYYIGEEFDCYGVFVKHDKIEKTIDFRLTENPKRYIAFKGLFPFYEEFVNLGKIFKKVN